MALTVKDAGDFPVRWDVLTDGLQDLAAESHCWELRSPEEPITLKLEFLLK